VDQVATRFKQFKHGKAGSIQRGCYKYVVVVGVPAASHRNTPTTSTSPNMLSISLPHSICYAFLAAQVALAKSFSRQTPTSSIHEQLGPRLSADARIITSDAADFRNSTMRWQEEQPPSFAASVEPMTERDIQETVSRQLIHQRYLTSTDPVRQCASLAFPSHHRQAWQHHYACSLAR
jgi:hypothetical protein